MKYEWDLTHIFKSDTEAKNREGELNKLIDEFSSNINKYVLNSDNFLEGILLHLKINEYLEQVYCYYRRYIDLNSNDLDKKENFNRIFKVKNKVDFINQQFFDLIVENIEQINKYLDIPKLQKHKLYINRIYDRNKNGKEKESLKENIKNITSSIDLIYRRIIEKEIKFPKIKDEFGNKKEARRTFVSNNRDIRKKSYKFSRKALYNHISHISTLYDIKIKENILLSSIQGFNSPEDKNSLESELPHSLRKQFLNKIVENISVSHMYSSLRKKISMLDKFYVYDFAAPIFNFNKKYELEEALVIIKNSLNILGEEYIEKIDNAFLNGWIDIYPKEGKRFDSVSMITYCGVPYATLNYRDDFFSMRCLIHELGHSIHSSYAKENNDFEYFEYNLFVAEISSFVNEQLLFDYLKGNAKTEEEKRFILRENISYYQNGIFFQILLSLFEDDMYEKRKNDKVLEPNDFNASYLKYQKIIYGNDINFIKEDSYDWILVPHFILNEPFYIWKYALDKCIALYIVKKLKEDSGYLNKYLNFLKAGNSMVTIDLLNIIDVDLNDLSFVDEAIIEYKELLNELESIIK